MFSIFGNSSAAPSLDADGEERPPAFCLGPAGSIPDTVQLIHTLIPTMIEAEISRTGAAAAAAAAPAAAAAATDKEKLLHWSTARARVILASISTLGCDRAYEIVSGVGGFNKASVHPLCASKSWAEWPNLVVTTSSPLQELDVHIWIIGCISLMNACDLFARRSVGDDLSSVLTTAASAFQWRARTAPVAAQAEFDADNAPHKHAAAANALEHYAAGMLALCEANAERAMNIWSNGAVVAANRALGEFEKALQWARNVGGPDNLRPELVDVFAQQTAYCSRWLRVHAALVHFKTVRGTRGEYDIIDQLVIARAESGVSSDERAEIDRLLKLVEAECRSMLALSYLRNMNALIDSFIRGTPSIPIDAEDTGSVRKAYDWKRLYNSLANKR